MIVTKQQLQQLIDEEFAAAQAKRRLTESGYRSGGFEDYRHQVDRELRRIWPEGDGLESMPPSESHNINRGLTRLFDDGNSPNAGAWWLKDSYVDEGDAS